MKETGMWGHTPYLCYGQTSDQVCLFLHGQSGHKEEGERFAQIATPKGWQVVAIDLPQHGQRQGGAEPFLPWVVVPELEQVWQELQGRWKRIALRANSIGAWLAMLALAGKPVDTCLFVSPVVDMENLIQTMMTWAGVTEERLEREREIPTDFGQTLSWEYLRYVRTHPARRGRTPTAILYGARDHLTDRETVEAFAARNGCRLTVEAAGEHWFHTPQQLAAVDRWQRACLADLR